MLRRLDRLLRFRSLGLGVRLCRGLGSLLAILGILYCEKMDVYLPIRSSRGEHFAAAGACGSARLAGRRPARRARRTARAMADG